MPTKKTPPKYKYVAVNCEGQAYASVNVPQIDEDGYVMWLTKAPNRWTITDNHPDIIVTPLEGCAIDVCDTEEVFDYNTFIKKYPIEAAAALKPLPQLPIAAK